MRWIDSMESGGYYFEAVAAGSGWYHNSVPAQSEVFYYYRGN